ncbi:uncharacterized protein [Amphiura filiformis]|uniref:uncharacterized protein isoform X2 n=1 Tax=Amphiura filiformis TaxID=82378 RepID=UPI003B21DDD4
MSLIIKCTPFVALMLIFLHKVHGEEQPVAMSHHSYHQFEAGDIFQTEGRSKRAATVLAFTASQAQEIVDLHNTFRGSVRPEASNMEYMKWDNDLARMAMRYSQRCHWGHGHVINVSPYSSVGQNLWIQGLSNRNAVPRASGAVNAWHNEARNYNFNTHECAAPHQCGHYTQLVWAETTSLGCGLSFCPRTSNWTHSDSWIMTCYYGPAGNYIGVRPYVSGPSCTQCKSEVGQCYNNMCRLCSDHNEPCDCRQQCVNCGTVDPFSCTCICQDGWYGPDCGKFCNETHPYCGANPGWPGPSYCGTHQMIPKHCPKMCGLCVDPDPTFVCNPPQPTAVYPRVTAAPVPPQNTPRNPGLPATRPPPPAPPQGTSRPVPPTRPRFGPTFPPTRPRFPPTFPPTRRPPVKPPVRPPFRPVNPPFRPVNPPFRPVNPPFVPTYPPPKPTVPRFPAAGPTAVDCKIPCRNGGIQDMMTCRCTCPPTFTGQYCQHDLVQIQNGAMLRLVGDIRDWGMMEYDMHAAIKECVDMFCNGHITQCCPGVHTDHAGPALQLGQPAPQLNYLDMTNVVTGTGFPEVDAFRPDNYWILLAATEPNEPQLCTEGHAGAAVEPALLLRKRGKRDASGSSESGEAGGPAPTYVAQPIMLNAVDQNMAAIQNVLQMYNVRLAEVQRGQKLTGSGASAVHPSVAIIVSLVMLIFNALFV